MGDIINLRTARKARSRAVSEAKASANRLLHGRTRAEKEAEQAERQRLDRTLDGAKREQD